MPGKPMSLTLSPVASAPKGRKRVATTPRAESPGSGERKTWVQILTHL